MWRKHSLKTWTVMIPAASGACLKMRRALMFPILCHLCSDFWGREYYSHFTDSREWRS